MYLVWRPNGPTYGVARLRRVDCATQTNRHGKQESIPDWAQSNATLAPGILLVELLHLRPPCMEVAHLFDTIPHPPQCEAASLDVPAATAPTPERL